MAKPLALTSGEPAGIGPDIAIEAWLRRNDANLPPFYLLGDRAFFADRAKHLGLKASFAEVGADEAATAFAKALPVVATGIAATAPPGRPDGSSAGAVLASIRQAVDDVAAGRASAVVTNPIAKSVLYRAGFKHPGHTEFLAELASQDGRTPQPVMMLWSATLAVVPVTIHLPLREAIAQLSSELHRRHRPHRGRRSEIALRHRQSPAGDLRPQSACRRIRHARHRGGRNRSAGDRRPAQPRHRGARPAAGRHHVPRSGAQDL